MLAELGHFLLILSLIFCSLLAVLPLTGAYLNDRRLMLSAVPLSVVFFALVSASFLILAALFLQDDFSVALVATHSNAQLPLQYKLTAVWGSHEGSLLLWILTLSGWTAAVALLSRSIPVDMRARVLSIMGMLGVGFLLFCLFTSNPFERLLPNIPLDGKDLNPLLQDIGMVMHPPMLYMGYVGFSVAFSFAVAALLSGEFDSAWVRWTRPWTVAAWLFLTLGIALGSWWAYYELGWGGWWFWDPVENASFMPWLMGTALIHSLAVTEQRGLFKNWTILLAIFTFALSLLGTFLVRSGVLTSVHAFATDPGRGLFILAFLSIVVGGSLTLFALRAPTVVSRGSFSWLSKDMFLLANNVILVVAAVSVLVGTLFPMAADLLELGKYSVGPPYFDTIFIPLMALLMLLMPVGVLLHWKKTNPQYLRGLFKALLPITVVFLGFFILLHSFPITAEAVAALALAAWMLSSMIYDVWHKTRYAKNFKAGLKRLSLSFYGMQLAHLGLVISAVGIVIVSIDGIQQDNRMEIGDSVVIEAYRFQFNGTKSVQGPNYMADQGHIAVYKGEKKVTDLYPEKRRYFSQMGNTMTEAAIHPHLLRDLFVALGEPLENGAWTLRLQYKPMIRWIWLGALFMALGGIFAILDKRYRKHG